MQVLRRAADGSLRRVSEGTRTTPVLRRQAAPAPTPPPQLKPGQQLPPRSPEKLEDLYEAVQLLGGYINANGKLNAKPQQRLIDLVGCLPRLQDAKAWKSGLKALAALKKQKVAETG